MNENLQAIRQRIVHEDDLMNQRLSALLASQAFLVTAYAITLNAPKEFVKPGYQHTHELLLWYIPWVAIGCVVFIWLGVLAAVMALQHLRALARDVAGPQDLPIFSTVSVRVLGQAAPLVVPFCFLVLWIVLLQAAG